MKIGIIGSGNVGGTLGKGWAKHGHEVVFAFRNPGTPEAKKLVNDAGGNSRAASSREAAQICEVIVLATPWEVAQEALAACGDLTGRIVIDAMNPLLPGLSGLSVGTTNSGGEQVAAWAKGAKVVKAFNTIGFNVMADSHFPQGKAALFYCGDDVGAKEVVKTLATELGFDALDAGPLSQCRVIEPFALLWISLAMKYGYGRDIAFQLLRRPAE